MREASAASADACTASAPAAAATAAALSAIVAASLASTEIWNVAAALSVNAILVATKSAWICASWAAWAARSSAPCRLATAVATSIVVADETASALDINAVPALFAVRVI